MNSLIGWIGGKKYLRQFIIPKIPQHSIYCEVFGGAGWVLFGKPTEKGYYTQSRYYAEIYNDLNGDLVNFWKYVKFHPNAFLNEVQEYFVSREIFENPIFEHPRTDLERAIRFYYKLKSSYGCQMKNFNIFLKGKRTIHSISLQKLYAMQERLKDVQIERQDFEKLILKVDSEETFFYLDPPYHTKEDLYIQNNTPTFEGHERMAQILKNIKGKFILSYNDVPYIRDLYKEFNIQTVEAYYSADKKSQNKTFTELIIMNFTPLDAINTKLKSTQTQIPS